MRDVRGKETCGIGGGRGREHNETNDVVGRSAATATAGCAHPHLHAVVFGLSSSAGAQTH